ncbi:Asp23/Gls24 family envelope stress response protein, partial [Streptomyces clavuligerus]|uniref:Asp23/Gls24 family envelope stress response protein n=1 Tax=Streptomyces clavuligerus TaxID=1901 RepID=UPI001E31B390
DRVPGGRTSVTRGVKAEVGEVQTALDLEIVVDYGVSISEVARAVRSAVSPELPGDLPVAVLITAVTV